MNTPVNLKYAKSDEWFDPASGAVGISDYAQFKLSDITYVEIRVEVGDNINAGENIGTVDSAKSSSEIYSPVRGKVTAINSIVLGDPELLNKDPYIEGWMIKVEAGSKGDLMDAATYEKYCEEREH